MEVNFVIYDLLISSYWIVLVFNVIGNSLVIFLISRKNQRVCTDYLLLKLAVADVVFGVLVSISQTMIRFGFISSENLLLCKLVVSGNIGWISVTVSANTTLVLSIERYFAVCRPHSFQKWFSVRNVKVMILLTWIISVSMVFPQMAEKACMGFKDITDMKIHSIFALAYVLAMSLFLAGMSVKIYVTWWCKQTSIQPTALREIEERKKKKKVTMCVLAVVVTYIIFYIPLLPSI